MASRSTRAASKASTSPRRIAGDDAGVGGVAYYVEPAPQFGHHGQGRWRTLLRLLAVIPSITMASNRALAEEPPAAPDGGSPICVWEIGVALLAYADAFGVSRNSARREVLKDSADLVRRFIIENSNITAAALAGARADIFADCRERKANEVDLCDPRTTSERVPCAGKR